MPTLRDIEVHVTDGEGNALAEYGVHKLSKSNMVSCFIESKTNQPFRVTVKPTAVPFPGYPPPEATAAQPRTAYPRGALEFDDDDDDDDNVSDMDADFEPRGSYARDLPFDLLATMRLDGREKHEKQVIVYLDPDHPSYATHCDGKVVFRARLMRDADGNIRETGWVFRDVGIDDLLSALGISSGGGGGGAGDDDDAVIPLTAEDELSQAFGKLGEGKLADQQESQAGQICISLEKIIVKHTHRGAWKPSTDSSKDEAGATSSSLKDSVTHTVGRDAGTGRAIEAVDAIIYEAWPVREERKFATFVFYYRGKEALEKFGFEGFARGAERPGMATRKGELAKGKLIRGVGELGRKRGGDEGVGGPRPKEGRWEMELQVRDGRDANGRSVEAGAGDGQDWAAGEKKAVAEDEAAVGKSTTGFVDSSAARGDQEEDEEL